MKTSSKSLTNRCSRCKQFGQMTIKITDKTKLCFKCFRKLYEDELNNIIRKDK